MMCSHNAMVATHDPAFAWKCADCGYIYGKTPARDACESCHGARGGVPGNENIVGGRVLCDYCHEIEALREHKRHLETIIDELSRGD